MIVKNVHFTLEQINFLEELNQLSFAEHVRRAVDEYIVKKKNTDVSVSLSKGVDDNG